MFPNAIAPSTKSIILFELQVFAFFFNEFQRKLTKLLQAVPRSATIIKVLSFHPYKMTVV